MQPPTSAINGQKRVKFGAVIVKHEKSRQKNNFAEFSSLTATNYGFSDPRLLPYTLSENICGIWLCLFALPLSQSPPDDVDGVQQWSQFRFYIGLEKSKP